MKSFIKSHRRSGSNPAEPDPKPPVTPRLSHSTSAFSLRQKTPVSSPTLYNSAFTTSPLAPPAAPALYKTPSSTSSLPNASPTAESLNGNKRFILKGLLKHKSSKTSLSSPSSKPSSPVIASKSFVTFADSSLPLPSQTPEFVVDRPNFSYLNIINERNDSGNQKIFGNKNDSEVTTSTTNSDGDLSIEHVINSATTQSSTALETAPVISKQVSRLNHGHSDDKSEYSFQSSKIEVEAADQKESDAESQKSSDSSEFSFEANRTYGRSSSIKYYKQREDIDKEEAHAAGRAFINDFIGNDVDVSEFQEDLNYDDSDEEDDTRNLFSRKLFSSDEEDNANDDDYDAEDDDLLEDEFVGPASDMSDNEDIGGDTVSYDIEDNLVSRGDVDSAGNVQGEEQILSPANLNRLEEEVSDLGKVVHEQKDQLPKKAKEVSFEAPEVEDSHITNSVIRRHSQMTVEPDIASHRQQMPNMGSTQRIKLGLNLRTKSMKYHQLSDHHDDDLKFLNSRYSWYVNDEEAARIQQKLAELALQGSSLDNEGALRPNVEYESQFRRGSTSSSDKFDDSLLDEINEIPEDFEFDFQGSNAVHIDGSSSTRKLSNSTKNKAKRAAVLMAPSASTGTKFSAKDKTVTLFRSSSAKSKSSVPECVDVSDSGSTNDNGDDYSFVTPVDSLDVPPNAAFQAHDSPLTTISEASFDGSHSPKVI